LTWLQLVLMIVAMKSAPRIAVGYVRVSTERQASEGVSLGAQEARIRTWAEAQGLQVAAVHVDAGLSGGRADNRPALQEALRDVCKRRGVLVSERTTSAMDHLRRQDRRISGKVPFGYQEAEDGQLVPDEAERAVIDRIRSLRSEGATFREIVSDLKATGTTTKTGLLTWTPATIRGVLLRDERLRIAA